MKRVRQVRVFCSPLVGLGLIMALSTAPVAGASSVISAPPGPATELGQYCGTESAPATAPEALGAVNAPAARALGYDGAGVSVAVLTDGVDITNPDLQRNPAYGPAGEPVITQYQDFSGDGTAAVTDGAEAFGDVSSIAAQGNQAYNLADYVNPAQAANLPPGGCWVKIVGAAPGADILVLKVIPTADLLMVSGIVQAVQYAVRSGAKVIVEPFGFAQFPDTDADAVRAADDAAVAAGVTVVVSSGDAGATSTVGSPATDPHVISVGATATLATYAQTDEGGFDNPAVGNGQWANNNVSPFSSGGFNQAGNTIDLVAPGQANWALCSTDTTLYTGCADTLGGTDNGVQVFGGTSESGPLTAAAAADVIQAYASTHGGTDPSPAQVKAVLMSTATDIDAPADEQGAGLLNEGAAVQLATSMPGATAAPLTAVGTAPSGGLLLSPSQVNITAAPGTVEHSSVVLTNTSAQPVTADLSTRGLTDKVSDTGTQAFTLSPTNPTSNTGAFAIWNGVTEVYQTETFSIPAVAGLSRLIFSAAYPNSGQTSSVHVALFEPDGTYAAYADPQGLSGYTEAEVTNPPPGTWTALFFTEQNGNTSNSGTGTSGVVRWDASTWAYSSAATVAPSQLTIAAGQSATATVDVAVPAAAGDNAQSLVVTSPFGQTTLPITVRAWVPMTATGGTFGGVLTGGNGRTGAPAQTGTYQFKVPSGEKDVDVSVVLANNDSNPLVAYLVGPSGSAVASSSNYTLVPAGTQLGEGSTRNLELYHLSPGPGLWSVVLEWTNQGTGLQLSDPFTGTVRFDQVRVSSDLPDARSAKLARGKDHTYQVHVRNTGSAPEGFFVDARLPTMTTRALANLTGGINTAHMTLPRTAGFTFPYYLVPTHTTQLTATLQRTSGTVPVTFDLTYFPGDPDVSPGTATPGTSATSGPAAATLTVRAAEVPPGAWAVNPDEVGPYPATGAAAETAHLRVTARTRAIDPAVSATTDDLWAPAVKFNHFLYLPAGRSGVITVRIKPSGRAGTSASGTLFVDDFVMASTFSTLSSGGDELAALPYAYTVAPG